MFVHSYYNYIMIFIFYERTFNLNPKIAYVNNKILNFYNLSTYFSIRGICYLIKLLKNSKETRVF